MIHLNIFDGMEKRKFTQPIAMIVPDYLKWCDLANKMIQLGYRAFSTLEDREFPWKMYTSIEDHDTAFVPISSGYCDWTDSRMIELADYNPELFLALAAMTEGGDFFVGEVAMVDERIFYHCKENGTLECYFVDKSENIKVGNIQASKRKATREEIIAHFSKKDDVKCAPRLPGSLTEERSPRGVMPRWRWLELRAIELQEAIDRFHTERQGPPESYYSEWNIIVDELTKLGKVPTFTQIEAAKKLTELLQVPLIRITKD